MKRHYKKISRKSRNDKRDWYSARPITLPKIVRELQSRGYQDIQLQQIWRNVHGTVTKNGHTYFFKMASTVGISRGARNEVRWNKYLSQTLTPSQQKILSVPEVYTTGIIEDCFFFVSDFIDGKALADQSRKIRPSSLSPWISDIVQTWLILGEVKPTDLVWDSIYTRVMNPGRKFFKRAEKYYADLKDPDFLPLLNQARNVSHTYTPALNHGDMTPWHFIARKEKGLYLIDAEQASSALPRYYDIAYFFHRLATMGEALDLAKGFLAHYRDQLSVTARADFDKRLPPIVAERVLGGFWDVTCGGNHASGRTIRPYRDVMSACLKGQLY